MVCVVCKKEVVWEDITEEFEDLFEQVNAFGMESATEHQQILLEGKICSFECYCLLD